MLSFSSHRFTDEIEQNLIVFVLNVASNELSFEANTDASWCRDDRRCWFLGPWSQSACFFENL